MVDEKSGLRSDALVFFGATGDLAHKKIFLALKRGTLGVPVIRVAFLGGRRGPGVGVALPSTATQMAGESSGTKLGDR